MSQLEELGALSRLEYLRNAIDPDVSKVMDKAVERIHNAGQKGKEKEKEKLYVT